MTPHPIIGIGGIKNWDPGPELIQNPDEGTCLGAVGMNHIRFRPIDEFGKFPEGWQIRERRAIDGLEVQHFTTLIQNLLHKERQSRTRTSVRIGKRYRDPLPDQVMNQSFHLAENTCKSWFDNDKNLHEVVRYLRARKCPPRLNGNSIKRLKSSAIGMVTTIATRKRINAGMIEGRISSTFGIRCPNAA